MAFDNPQEDTPSFLEKVKDRLRPMYHKWVAFKTARPKTAWLGLIGGSTFLFGFIFIFTFYALIRFEIIDELPSGNDLAAIENSIASEVYSEDRQLLGKYYIQNRINANLEDISPVLVNALVATEDARFFEHGGVDFRSWFRVFFKSILLQDDDSGGGSTLSQQLAKNLYPRKRYRFLSLPVNKVREMIVARRLERIYSKKELLAMYLNTVSFSDNTFGIKVATKRFFNTNPKNVRAEEAAVLVGMLKGTSIFNPINHPERSLKRRNVVLSQMNRYGYLVGNPIDSLQALPLNLSYKKEGNTEGTATYFREHLRLELNKLLKDHKKEDGSNYNLYKDGLKIYTTIDSRLQLFAEEAVAEHMRDLQATFFRHWKQGKPWGSDKEIQKIVEQTPLYQRLKKEGKPKGIIDEVLRQPKKMTIFTWDGDQEKEMSVVDSIKYYQSLLNTGFLATNPRDGRIKAWIGGIDNKYFQYDHIKSKRQPGSTFKPLVYAAALQQEIPPCEYNYNRLVTYTEYDDWTPENSDGKYDGVYSMEGALSNSVNAVTVDMMMRVGIASVKTLAQQMGISSTIPDVPSIALGTAEVSLYDMVQVYSTFANQGARQALSFIRRIETKEGEVLIDFDEEERVTEQVLTPAQAMMMTKMLQSVVDSGTARRLRFRYDLQNDIAGKTGTTQNHSDGWFIGYTPDLVAGAWVGAESPAVRFRTIALGQGANTALPIWGRFMKKVYGHPAFKASYQSTFPTLPDSIQWQMDCPPYLADMPIYEALPLLEGEETIENVFDWIFKNKRGEEIKINEGPSTQEENRKKQTPKAKKRRTKPKKKKKKKGLFKRIFGGN